MLHAKKLFTKKTIFFVLGVAAMAVLFLLPPPTVLDNAAAAVGSSGVVAMRILGVTALAIFWWAGEVMPDWSVAIAMLLMWILLAKLPFKDAFAGFTGSSIWLVFGAFCLAAGITKTGFFLRISWFLLRLFSPTFRGQVLAMLVVGTVCAPLIPSASAKAVLGATIAKNIADAMGYEPNSRGRCGIFIASFMGFVCITPAFMSGSAFCYAALGVMEETARSQITWGSWLLSTIPWLVIALAGSFLFINLLYKPTEESQLTREYVQSQYRALGRMHGKETIAAILLTVSVLLWILESELGIEATVTALFAAIMCFATRLLQPKELSTAVPWGLVIFIGSVTNLGTVFSSVGINGWLKDVLTPLFVGIQHPILVILVIVVLMLALRVILVSQTATVILAMAILTPAVSALNIHPFVVAFVALVVQQCWFLSYQNVVFIPALGCMDGTITHKSTVKACVAYEILAMLGFCISIPYWSILHLM